MSTTDKYRAEEPRYLCYCGTKKYRKGDGTGTVEKWYRGAAVVPWYRATLMWPAHECGMRTIAKAIRRAAEYLESAENLQIFRGRLRNNANIII